VLEHGLTSNGAAVRVPTVVEKVRAAGYRTGAFLGAQVIDRDSGLHVGFEHYDDRWGMVQRLAWLPALAELHLPQAPPRRSGAETVDRALEWLRPAMKVCAQYNVVVLIHTGDGPFTIPTMFYPIIREFPMVNFVIAHFGIQTGGNYSFETFWMAMDTPNVYVESGWCFQARIAEFAKELPRRKLVFGTDSPPNEPGMWLRELEMLCRKPPHGIGIDEDTLEDYLGNNVARMVGIETSLPPRSFDEACTRLGRKVAPQPVIPLY